MDIVKRINEVEDDGTVMHMENLEGALIRSNNSKVKLDYEFKSEKSSNKLIELKHGHLGSLTQIANVLYDEMLKEIKRNGYSDLTLTMEASVHGINEIIKLNGIKE